MQYGLAYAHTGAASNIIFFMKGPAAKEDSYLPQQRQGGPLLIHLASCREQAGALAQCTVFESCGALPEACHCTQQAQDAACHPLVQNQRSLSYVARSACLLALVAQHSTHASQVTCQIRSLASQTSKAVYFIQQQALHGNAAGCC